MWRAVDRMHSSPVLQERSFAMQERSFAMQERSFATQELGEKLLVVESFESSC
jgi:hypothetical protein